MNASKEESWDSLDTLWRSQAVSPPDLERLRREARARGWRLRALTAFEWSALAVTGAFFWRFMAARPGWQAVDAVLIGLYAFTAAFTLWTTYNRRDLSHGGPLAPDALVHRERRRAEASLRFWRANAWVTLLIFAALASAAIAESTGLIDAPGRASWWTVLAINTPLVIASWVLHRRRSRTLRARLERLQALAEQLDA